MEIKKKYLIEKRNILNEMRTSHMTLQEIRFMSIYMAKINARDPNSRVVKFSINDFRKIMNLGKLNHIQLKHTFETLLQKIVYIPDKNGGFECFQLFKKCKLSKNVDQIGLDQWFITIDAHDDALPLMFDFRKEYFTYELWNALRLKSFNQIRIYEILKQYEKVGERILSIQELKELLCIKKDKYSNFKDFRNCVLEPCKKALAQTTDIKYIYEVCQRGAKGKILSLKFTIEKNPDFIDQFNIYI